MSRAIDLSHTVEEGMTTYPGLPGPVISQYLGFDESQQRYAQGTEFSIGRIEFVANTGTYLDTPAHRYRDGTDLAGLPLEAVVDLPGLVVEGAPTGATTAAAFAGLDVAGSGVLVRTGWDRHWRTEHYGDPSHPFLDETAVRALVEGGAALVGIDSVNIDGTAGGERPAHSALLGAGIPVVEHLTGLAALGPSGSTAFRFFAVPPRVAGLATFPVRAFALV